MARILKRGRSYHLAFRHGGRHYSRSLKTGHFRKADGLRARAEDTLAEIERGRLEVPPGADLPAFLLSDGKLPTKVTVRAELALKEFFQRYQSVLPEGAKEQNTRYIEDIHINHLLRLLQPSTLVRSITAHDLQAYIQARSGEEGRHGNRVSHETVRKEIGTFASIWNRWAEPLGFVTGPAPTRNLLYCKHRTKSPFRPFSQVSRLAGDKQLKEGKRRTLWESVFLSLTDIEAVLAFVPTAARAGWVFPMFAMAAYTGARRSELLRTCVEDLRLGEGIAVLREKKRDREHEFTFRQVPLPPVLVAILHSWLGVHPGGGLLFCERSDVPISLQMSSHHFKYALENSPFAELTGWHVFRHSYASNCALKGVDPRVLDRWLGHQTEQMRQRYLHLFPEQQQQEIARVFAVVPA